MLFIIQTRSNNIYLLLTDFEDRTVSDRPRFLPIDLWPKREARVPNLGGRLTVQTKKSRLGHDFYSGGRASNFSKTNEHEIVTSN